MKKIGVILILITIFVLRFSVIYPKNMGERTPVWELQQRFFGEEYAGLRSEYFISLNYRKQWPQYKEDSIFYVTGKSDLFNVKEVYLGVSRDIAENFIVRPTGTIEFRGDEPHMVLYADALMDEPLNVKVKSNDYILDGTEETDSLFTEETGMNAGELLNIVQIIRQEFRSGLNALSEAEYQKTCGKITVTARKLTVMWGIYALICCLFYFRNKLYEKRLEKDMKPFLEKCGNTENL